MILLVQDDPFLRRPLASELRRGGFSVIEVSRAEDAMVWLNASAHGDPVLPFPDLLITAEALPDLGGLELLESIRRSGESVPAILMLDWASDLLRRRASELGACLVLEGAFEIANLHAAVRCSLGLQLVS
jgi:DNA-binding response OmpR family regulator